MTDRAALLAAVLAAPADDAPRLVYADWLDEHGEPDRAEFVRVQIECARLDRDEFDHVLRRWKSADADRRSWELAGRESALWLSIRMTFWRSLPLACVPAIAPGINAGTIGEAKWAMVRRGFVERITCPAADWLRFADAILADHPVTEVRLTTEPKCAEVLTRSDRRPFVVLIGADGLLADGCGVSRSDAIRDAVSKQWPQVKTWHLPADEGVTLTPYDPPA